MKGVKKVVRVGDNAVAVIADTWWHAKTALDALPIVWDEGDNAKVSSESIAKWLGEGPHSRQPAFLGNPNTAAEPAPRPADRRGRRRQRQGFQRVDRQVAGGRPRQRTAGLHRQPERRRESRRRQ